MKLFIKLLCLCLIINVSALAQKTEGIVSYDRKSYWTKIIARLTFLSQEQKDRAAQTWKNEDEDKEKMKLLFTPTESVYTYLNDQGQTEDGNYSWRNRDLLLYRNYDKERKTEIEEMLGKTYIVDDSLRTPTWRILDQIKEVAGHICMKAETEDPIKKHKVTAWFAQDIPVSAGPERYSGLPGLILELDINGGDVIIEATKVEFKPVAAEIKLPKLKGKKITSADYDKMIQQHIAESITAHRNPYWAIRY
ncbi:Protein of unknown function, Porph ging [Fibrisoma limi BUZ 3]|uniref:GLPGLI family protein n=1 Tax=Fibrisoma limi BUZ 3 TaxID=1185876 RepID=I2GLI3_9BACT|nr:GLPGLI family protein [Fibrisoma limi]CCH54759.1 Protein of unknown function, Porph ging [Fibrisoma limi BUZ 3]